MNILISFQKCIVGTDLSKIDSHLKFLSLDKKNHYFLISSFKENRILNSKVKILKKENFTLINLSKYFQNENWHEAYKILNSIKEDYKIDRFLIIEPMIRAGVDNLKDISYLEREYNKTLENPYLYNNFIQTRFSRRNYFINYYFKFIEKIKTTQICSDPLEFNFNEKRWYYYDRPDENLKRLPSKEYGLLYNKDFDSRINKTQDFVFGCTITTKDRLAISKPIDDLFNTPLSENIFVKDNYTKKNNLISNIKYSELLHKSKFTYIIPAYKNDHFSSLRFFDALCFKTIPLLHPDSNREDGLKHYPDLKKVMSNLVCEIENLDKFIKEINYGEYIKKIYECDDMKMLNKDLDFYKKHFEEFFNYEFTE